MDKEEEKNLSHPTTDEPFDFKIDKTPSLWNQLRLAWRDFHLAKKKENKPEIKRFEILISNLLKELVPDEKHTEIFQLTIDEIPKKLLSSDLVEAN